MTDDLSLIIYQLQALDKIPIKILQFSYFRHKNVPIISVCGRVLVTKHTKVRQAHWVWGGFSSGGITFALYITHKYLKVEDLALCCSLGNRLFRFCLIVVVESSISYNWYNTLVTILTSDSDQSLITFI